MKLTSLAFVLLVAGCGNNSLSTQDMSSSGKDLAVAHDLAVATGDLSVPADMTYHGPATDGGPLMCGSATCAKGDVCCVTGSGGNVTQTCAASCADGGVSLACSGPGQCGGNPCCATLENASPKNVVCETSMSACPPSFDLATKSGMTRMCNVSGDCVAGLSPQQMQSEMYKDCCHSNSNSSFHFCFSAAIATGFPQAGITCP
jgi:hypothetical protein